MDYQEYLKEAKNIVAILDFDGHHVDRSFVPKELALKGLGNELVFSCFFFHNKPLSSKDQRTANWVYHNIFDIRYNKYWFGMLKPSAIENVLQAVQKQGDILLDTNPWYVAYKGGHYERDILRKLNIPSLNLELIGCPKVEAITPLTSIHGCGKHRSSKSHCPAKEVQLFQQWLEETMDFYHLPLNYSDFKMKNPMCFVNKEDFAVKLY